MKTLLLLTVATAATFLVGCRTVAVTVDRDRHRGHSHTVARVSYYEGRPYYYSGRSRVWGYPPGYHGSRTYIAPGHRVKRATVYY